MTILTQAIEFSLSDVAATELMFIEDSSLELVGGGTITNTL
jgi:hypothetical protein